MKCFFHSADLDGHCSGELIRRVHPECEMIGINYGQPFPWEEIEEGETVYMVDFSLQPWTDMQRLAGMCDLVWIDHHKSAIEECEKEPIEYRGIVRDGLGACELVRSWILNEEGLFPDEHPEPVMRLAEYDVWNHSHPHTLPFQYGMRLYDTFPGQPIWDRVFTPGGYQQVRSEGELILRFSTEENRKRARALCFETELDGLRCIAANIGLTNSKLFDSVWDPSRHDAMLTFHWRRGQWYISMYSDKENVDVSKVAVAHGGGGHNGAAGFQCAELPFKLA